MIKISRILQILTYLVVVVSYASVFHYLEHYHSLSFLLLLILSLYLSFHRIIRIPRWVLNAISIAILVISALAISTEYLVEPVLGALIVLVAIKLLEEKTFRDYAQIFAMCIFLLIGSSLLSLSIAFLGYFSLIALFSTTALIFLAYFAQQSEIAIRRSILYKVLLQSLLICSIALPGSLIFFIILPRTSYPIFSFLNKGGYAMSGFTDTIRLGEISEIQEDNNVIFRAQMPKIAEDELYWRGIVLDAFDGSSWKNSGKRSRFSMTPLRGREIVQVVYLEPYGNRFLFALDKPWSIALRNVYISDDLSCSLPDSIHERIRYEVKSYASNLVPDQAVDRRQYLQMPSDFSPRIGKLVEDLTKGKSDAEIVRAILQYIDRGSYRYSMEDLPQSADPLEDFLFQHKAGNCEFFASSLAVMLRMAGIPARLVGGYRGGYYNNTGGYYMVLQHNAHVWVEAYLPHREGWIRLDPTLYARMAPATERDRSFFLQFKLLLDTFNYYWYTFIINYDFSRQLALLKKIKAAIQKPDIKIDLAKERIRRHLYYLPAVLLLGILGYVAVQTIMKKPDDRLLNKFQRKLRRRGYVRKPCEGLEEFAARIHEQDLRIKAQEVVARFESIYFKDQNFTREDLRSLNRRIDEL
ncbi:MAG: DUF3488 and transglutaminase-like domain-containing protein [Desulforhabdus sp.]|jgi:transglutaminase-like putative cysteine protease|nr:DUF3488 and transglutaminase-like domain-containing protein [Desulforhabdus sp.]